tara:strand:- start:48424 stop:49188 length:765 start_codon:yes stop_codon:yes gene_type:complete
LKNLIVPQQQNKLRLDTVLINLKLFNSRQKAVSKIISGAVFIDDKKIDKPGFIVKKGSYIKIIENEHEWVSRGGIKLSYAIKYFNLKVREKICIDIGSSTGGFTEVLISNGANLVYSIDVGYGQLDWKLRNNNKVKVLERTNARYLDEKKIKDKLDLLVCDVSFISLKKVIPPSLKFLNPKSSIILLIKPQFEAGRKYVGKGGIIKDKLIHNKVCNELIEWFTKNLNLNFVDLIESPIKGQKGNKEFFLYMTNN